MDFFCSKLLHKCPQSRTKIAPFMHTIEKLKMQSSINLYNNRSTDLVFREVVMVTYNGNDLRSSSSGWEVGLEDLRNILHGIKEALFLPICTSS